MSGPGPGFADFRITVDDGGTLRTFEARFATWGLRVRDMTPAWTKIGLRLMGDFRENFAAQGGAFMGTSAWAPLRPSTVRQRLKLGFGGGPIMMRTGTLVDSLSVPGAAGNVFEVGPEHVSVGSDVPYAPYQHWGTRRGLPARSLIGLTWETQSYALRAVADYVREQARNAGFEEVN